MGININREEAISLPTPHIPASKLVGRAGHSGIQYRGVVRATLLQVQVAVITDILVVPGDEYGVI
jgi:hypothetical protein